MTNDDTSTVRSNVLPSAETDGALRERVERLESELAAMRLELRSLSSRGQLREPPARDESLSAQYLAARSRTARSVPPVAAPAQPAPAPLRLDDRVHQPRRAQFEELLGRYGMLALGALTVIMGAGAFMGWAIQAGLLGPTVRVVLGAIASLAVAAGGMRLRARDMKDFGNALLALALAIAHVVAWSAGPLLHVIPSFVALLIVCAASLMLAEFALRKDEQTLFTLGFGGAMLAPFVTSSGTGTIVALATYGVTVLALAVVALAERPWTIARRMLAAAFTVYLLALLSGRGRRGVDQGMLAVAESLSALLFAAASVAAVALLGSARYRVWLLRVTALGTAVAAGLFGSTGATGNAWPAVGSIIGFVVGTAAAALAIGLLFVLQPPPHDDDAESPDTPSRGDVGRSGRWEFSPADEQRAHRWRHAMLDGEVIPIVLIAATIHALHGDRDAFAVARGLAAFAWAGALVRLTVRARGQLISDAFPVAASFAAIVAVLWLPLEPAATTVALAAVAVGLVVVHRRIPRATFVLGSMAALLLASVRAFLPIVARAPFSYTPMLGMPMAVALLVLVGYAAVWRSLRDERVWRGGGVPVARTLVGWSAAVFAFACVHGELSGAYSPTASIALLVAFYAVSGFVAIELGRLKGVRAVRLTGLGLSVLAAVKAVIAAGDIAAIGVRVGVLFGAGAFLMGVAYRYRKHLGAPATEHADQELS